MIRWPLVAAIVVGVVHVATIAAIAVGVPQDLRVPAAGDEAACRGIADPERRERCDASTLPCQLLPDGHGSARLRPTRSRGGPTRTRDRCSIDRLTGPAGAPAADDHADSRDRAAGDRRHRPAGPDLQRRRLPARRWCSAGGARRGAAAQRERRAGGHHPLARRRRARPGGRRRRGHAGCRPARRAVRVPLRRARCGDLLVPHASGLGAIRGARAARRDRRAAGSGVASADRAGRRSMSPPWCTPTARSPRSTVRWARPPSRCPSARSRASA